jgi:TonB family protein
LPEYPQNAVKRGKQGCVVVDVSLSETGAVIGVVVLETPDPQLGRAVETAVNKWKFRPFRREGKSITSIGKLIFYFRIEKDRHRVIDASGEQLRLDQELPPPEAMVPRPMWRRP